MLLAEIPQNLGESAEMIVIGILFVLSVLGTLAAIMALLGTGFRRIDQRADGALRASKAAVAAHAAEATAVSPVADGDLIGEELAAVIAAAVHATMGGAVRVVSISAGSPNWAAEGRRQIFSSHQVR